MVDKKIQDAQSRVLRIFAQEAKKFALAGGTALERFYLHHRFSWDLDFFSPVYDTDEIDRLIRSFQCHSGARLKKESELAISGRARVRFYAMPVKGASRPLKIDFVEDVLVKKPVIQTVEGIRVYAAETIYFQKTAAVAGIKPAEDETGRVVQEGRKEPRDIFDLYGLSRRIMPLHRFLAKVPTYIQQGMMHWYRTFSRQDVKLGVLDMEIYDKQFDAKAMIAHLEQEIRLFAEKALDS